MERNTPENLLYTKEHEWVKIEDNFAFVGITDFAQNALGDIVYVELPEVGQSFSIGDAFGVVESIKSVNDLFCPLDGTIVEVNESLAESPENCNKTPYESWFIKIEFKDKSKDFLNSTEYTHFCNEQ